MGTKPSQRPAKKAGRRDAALVGQQLDIGDARVVINGNVQILPANAVVEVHVARPPGEAVPHARDATEFLRVEVEQITGRRMFVALDDRRRF
jgi:hypothetical protein